MNIEIDLKIKSSLRHHMKSLARGLVLADNLDLINQTWKRVSKELKLKQDQGSGRFKVARKILRDLCHEGILGVFYKFTRDGKTALLVFHKRKHGTIMDMITKQILEIQENKKPHASDRLTKRIIDIIVYMGEACITQEGVTSVVDKFEDTY
jgi:hypothetical protein